MVIAIISILAGLLLPALSQARQQARTMSCVSNLKQNMLYMLMYANEFDDILPTAGYWPADSWYGCFMLAGYVTYKTWGDDTGSPSNVGTAACPTGPRSTGPWSQSYGMPDPGLFVLSGIKQPTRFIVLSDDLAKPATGTPYQCIYMTTWLAWPEAPIPVTRHKMRCGLGLADGHVEMALGPDLKDPDQFQLGGNPILAYYQNDQGVLAP